MFIDKSFCPDSNTNVIVKLEDGTITGAIYYAEYGFKPCGVEIEGNTYLPCGLDFTSPVIKWKPIDKD